MREFFVNKFSGNSGKIVTQLNEITREIVLDALREWAARSPNRAGFEFFPPVQIYARGIPFGKITSLVNSGGTPILINEGGAEIAIEALSRKELIDITRRIDGTLGGCRDTSANFCKS